MTPTDDRAAPAGHPSSLPTVEVRGAAAALGGRAIWQDVTFSLMPGEFVAVLGPNGAGKSTLVKAILGLLPLAGGDIRILGGDPGSARRSVGYLPQRRSFDPGVRIRGVDVVRLGLEGTRWGVPLPGRRRWSAKAKRDSERVEELIALVGADAYAREPIGRLSGGEQQRILIAQALVHRPRLLLLDEPLDSLDLPNQAAVAALVASLSRSEGVSTLLVTHDVNPVLSYLSGVVYLAGGKAVTGSVDQVINTQVLSDLYGAAVEVLRTSDGRLAVVGQPEAPAIHADRHGH